MQILIKTLELSNFNTLYLREALFPVQGGQSAWWVAFTKKLWALIYPNVPRLKLIKCGCGCKLWGLQPSAAACPILRAFPDWPPLSLCVCVLHFFYSFQQPKRAHTADGVCSPAAVFFCLSDGACAHSLHIGIKTSHCWHCNGRNLRSLTCRALAAGKTRENDPVTAILIDDSC